MAGLAEAIVEAIHDGEEPMFANLAEAAVYAFCRRLLTTRTMDQATYDQTRQAIGETGLVDLVGILGYYALISMTIVGFGVPTPDGAEPFGDA
jgi:4-carboxymuconolactone decarboxylase